MIDIRLVKDSDLDSFLLIEEECFKNPWNKEQLLYEFHDNPVNKIYVALDGDKLVGFINYMITFNSATISQIAVTEKYRKQGIATSLYEKMVSTFIKSGDDAVEFITLEVRESNDKALSFYKKMGFDIVNIKKNYYADGENAIYMVKGLI